MKSELTKIEVARKRPKLPLLAQSIHSNPTESFTVLFETEFCGAVVYTAPSAAYRVGFTNKGFVSCYNQNHWRILPPDEFVTLQND